jgi:hypothetical protein
MKSLFKICGLVAVLTLLAGVGCKNKVPTGSGMYALNPVDYSTVASFDLLPGTTTDIGAVNPHLLGMPMTLNGSLITAGTSSILTSGAPAGLHTIQDWLTQGPLVFVAVPAVASENTSHGAVHDFEDCTDPGDATYPTNQIRISLATGMAYYKLSQFSGVNFRILLVNNSETVRDTAKKRRFSVGTDVTLPPDDDPRGICNNIKRNNFGSDLTFADSDFNHWKQFSLPFAAMTQEAGYAAVTPADFASHMDKTIWLQWSEGNNNSAGTVKVNYWLDDVVFY